MPERSQEIAADVTALLRARNPLIWIVSREEARVEAYLIEIAAKASYVMRTWDAAQGVCDMAGKPQPEVGARDPGDMIADIGRRAREGSERGLWVMRDLPAWLAPPIGIITARALRNVARALPFVGRDSAQAIVVLSPSGDVPPELSNHTTVIDWPLPDREEIAGILDNCLASLPDEYREGAAPNGTRDAAIDAAVGLSGEEAQACYARSLIQHKRVEPASVAREKKRVIAREKVMEWIDPIPGGLDAVGGLDLLKGWLVSRKAAYSPQARAYGLPAPRGALLVGVPGCGKSLTAKAIATAWQVPLLRLDLGALKSKFVGESEGNLRKALRVIEAIGRSVVWLDEIEKALSGATDGAADGGVSSDALGTILSWMQERQGQAFVIATANDVSKLPPELLRKGRFDELWFVDLPTHTERAEIAKASLRQYGREPADDLWGYDIASATDGFTGAEIAALIPDALFNAYADDARPLTVQDILNATKTVVPLAKTASGKIDALRAWAQGRARPATTPEAATSARRDTARKLDL